MRLEYQRQNLMITGATSEIAVELVRLALESGFNLLLTASTAESEARLQQRYPDEIAAGRVQTALLELSSASDFQLPETFCPDYLVDLAQPDYESLIASADPARLERFFSASVTGRSALLKTVLRCMISQKFGRLVFVSSTACGRINAGQGFYSAAKAAAERLYESAGVEMGSRGITCAVLRPGYIDSGRGARYSRNRPLQKQVPTGRVLTTREVAQTLLFLLSDAALQINGAAVTMDGGMSRAKAQD